ncbi:MAG: hypothetical protein ACREP6_04915, partial [Candidatus Binataceae bacterium]
VEMLIKTYREAFQKNWDAPGRILLGVNFYGLDDERKAIAAGAKALAIQLQVFARNMLDHSAKFGEQYTAYREIGKIFEEMSDPRICEQRVLSEWPRYLALWGNRPILERKFSDVVERLRPDGLILNIDCGGIALEATAASMRFFAEQLMSPVRNLLERA